MSEFNESLGFSEPWKAHDDGSISNKFDFTVAEIGNTPRSARIVAAVNAMAGIPDPESFVKAHGELLEAADRLLHFGSTAVRRNALRQAVLRVTACARQEKTV